MVQILFYEEHSFRSDRLRSFICFASSFGLACLDALLFGVHRMHPVLYIGSKVAPSLKIARRKINRKMLKDSAHTPEISFLIPQRT